MDAARPKNAIDAPIEPKEKKHKTEECAAKPVKPAAKPEKEAPKTAVTGDMGAAWHAKLLAESFAMDLDDLPDEEVKQEPVTEAPAQAPERRGAKRGPENSSNSKDPGGAAAFHSAIRARVDAKKDLGAPVADTVRLGEGADWKQRYYFEKFTVNQEDLVDFLQRIRKAYVEGMCWVLQYYYQGCPSWTWFYPYHYAPFASDLLGMSSLKVAERTYFKVGRPFKPLQQLMSVLPPSSGKRAGIPDEMIALMTDPNSPIVDFFPTDFGLDLNGKRFTWMAVILLPFLDEPRLLRALEPFLLKLKGETLQRNSPTADLLFGHKSSPLGPVLAGKIGKEPRPLKMKFGPFGNSIGKREHESIPSPIEGLPDVEESEVIVTEFELAEDVPHTIQPLEGAVCDAQVVTDADYQHMQQLRGFGGLTAKRMILTALGKDPRRYPGFGYNQNWNRW